MLTHMSWPCLCMWPSLSGRPRSLLVRATGRASRVGSLTVLWKEWGPGGLSSLGHFMEDTSRVLGVGRAGPSGENFSTGLGVTQHGSVASECPPGLGQGGRGWGRGLGFSPCPVQRLRMLRGSWAAGCCRLKAGALRDVGARPLAVADCRLPCTCPR